MQGAHLISKSSYDLLGTQDPPQRIPSLKSDPEKANPKIGVGLVQVEHTVRPRARSLLAYSCSTTARAPTCWRSAALPQVTNLDGSEMHEEAM